MREFGTRLGELPPIVLDGAVGTELEALGVECALPLWSARALIDAPAAVRDVHASYARAGAEILTANTFRTQRRALASAGLESRDRDLTTLAIRLAREAAASSSREVWIAGSAPPLEDCYRPELVPAPGTLEAEHARHAENLAVAGADLMLVETMNTIREAEAAARAAQATGLTCLVSFVCTGDARLLSGEPLEEACDAVRISAPDALLVNCLPLSAVPRCLEVLRHQPLPFGVYANLGAPTDAGGRSEDATPEAFASAAADWALAGARLVGGCCGTGPDHIRAVADRLHTQAPKRS